MTAVQWQGKYTGEVSQFFGPFAPVRLALEEDTLSIGTRDEHMVAHPGDWIVKRGGTFVVCKPDTLAVH